MLLPWVESGLLEACLGLYHSHSHSHRQMDNNHVQEIVICIHPSRLWGPGSGIQTQTQTGGIIVPHCPWVTRPLV